MSDFGRRWPRTSVPAVDPSWSPRIYQHRPSWAPNGIGPLSRFPEQVKSREPGLPVPAGAGSRKTAGFGDVPNSSKVCGAPKKLSLVWQLTPPAFSAARPTPSFSFYKHFLFFQFQINLLPPSLPKPARPPCYNVVMATPAQITANQANAQKSTGPRSVEGKSASRFNA